MRGINPLLSDRVSGLFKPLGDYVARHWLVVVLGWIAVLAAVWLWAPGWDQITLDGDFAYLPDNRTSVRGQRLLEEAFPDHICKSQLVLVVARDHGKLSERDYEVADALLDEFTPTEKNTDSPVAKVLSYRSEVFGDNFLSPATEDGQAAVIMLELRTEFSAVGNMPFVGKVYQRLDAIRREPNFPAGLRLGVSGSAAVGYDYLNAAIQSVRRTEYATIALVAVILLLVYRAPGLVLIPLVTIAVSLLVAIGVMAMLVRGSDCYHWYDLHVFKTTEIFLIVILFGAGTDFCLFLISRYREELARSPDAAEALARAVGKVGEALVGSAATTIFGLAMMRFAEFGKFRDSGPTIAISLAIALLACMTLAPALLRAASLWVFWPVRRGSLLAGGGSEVELAPALDDPMPRSLTAGFWQWSSRVILAHPGRILTAAVVLMALPAWKGLSVAVNYDLLAELSSDRPAVQGAQLVRQYFMPGETGPITVLARTERPPDSAIMQTTAGNPAPSTEEHAPRGLFETHEGKRRIALLTRFFYDLSYPDEQGNDVQPVYSVRSLTEPLGSPPGSFNPLSRIGRKKLAVLEHPKTKAAFLSQTGKYAFQVTRFDLVLQHDPFSREAVNELNIIQQKLTALSSDSSSPWANTIFEFTGITAGIRDLQEVTSHDQFWIEIYVLLAVLAVLIVLIRRPVVCLYLIVSVLFSYFVTMGVTGFLFARLYGSTYEGLDWKVPLFLFVILMAIGQDYNIYLLTRVHEEQSRLGPLAGLRRALVRTGGIITSCGIIMAGTFLSMSTGALRGMHELGFALSFGVLLDTLVVRTMLVPAFLVLVDRFAAERPAAETGLDAGPGIGAKESPIEIRSKGN
jgi:RND superfamily putative drug exporter